MNLQQLHHAWAFGLHEVFYGILRFVSNESVDD